MITVWTPRAKQHAKKILDYCLIQFGKRITSRFAKALEDDTLRLANNPYMGYREELLCQKDYEIRSLPEGHYKIVYYIDDREDTIYILALFDCRRNPLSLGAEIE